MNNIDKISDNKKKAESKKSQAELELLNQKKLVRELTSQVQESKAKTKERMKEFPILNKAERIDQHRTLEPTEAEDHKHIEISREVETLKLELSKIRLDVARIAEEKSNAEKEAETACLRMKSYMRSTDQLIRQIEEANEEEVLVELARIQARKELAEIEGQRKEEGDRFLGLIEGTRKKISALRKELEDMKDLEEQLATTNSDIEVLQQVKLIKEMDQRMFENSVQPNNSDLELVRDDIEAAKKELESIKGGTCQLMTGMDATRIKLIDIRKEKDQLMSLEEKGENYIQRLNSELLQARDKLAMISQSEKSAKLMLSSLSVALEKLETEKESAKKEGGLIREKIASIKVEIQKTESETDSKERLQVALQKFAEVEKSEAKALTKLKATVENVVTNLTCKKKSTITISRFEYDYLMGCALEAREMADKKVEAANSWEEALRASQRELKIKLGLAERNIKELKLKEEHEIHKAEEMLKAKELAEEELKNMKSLGTRKSIEEKGYYLNAARHAKFRRSSVGSPVTRRVSSSFTLKRRTKVMLKVG